MDPPPDNFLTLGKFTRIESFEVMDLRIDAFGAEDFRFEGFGFKSINDSANSLKNCGVEVRHFGDTELRGEGCLGGHKAMRSWRSFWRRSHYIGRSHHYCGKFGSPKPYTTDPKRNMG